jgi:hypothetical protein
MKLSILGEYSIFYFDGCITNFQKDGEGGSCISIEILKLMLGVLRMRRTLKLEF